jgi:TAG lipase/steryl ester hydrolase/phospholipase A2/LPA acyltransferase
MAQLPVLQQLFSDIIETVFVPRAMAKQLIVLIALETGMVSTNFITSLLNRLLSNFSSRSRLIRQLHAEQAEAATQEDWMDLAERIDVIQGNDVWRSDPNCRIYERDRISARIDELVHLMRRQDIFELMFVLRGSIGRNKFGLLHEGLFSKALAGTKVLVETYHNVVCAALDFCCDAPVLLGEDPIPTDARLAFFNETRHAYGRTALLLSGGAALGFYHVGVVKTLMDNNLLPRVISGSSAGSILCSMIGTRTDEECLRDLFDAKGTNAPGHSGEISLNFFRPLNINEAGPVTKEIVSHLEPIGGLSEVLRNTAGAFRDAKRTFQGFVPIPLRHLSSLVYDILTGKRRASDTFKNDTEHFRACVRRNVGNFTFQEAFDRTGRILNIVVTPNNSTDPPRLLNYLTAPHVLVWSAAVASSSLPGVFEANRLVVKEADGWERYESGGGQVFSDGSMEQDLPMQQLSEMFNVNHFIVSQANPHAVMFASYNQKVSVWANPIKAIVGSIVTYLKGSLRSWIAHVVECMGGHRLVPMFETTRGVGTQFFTQEYEGRPSDISLVPWYGHRGLFSAVMHIIYNPSEAEFREWIQAAERETWRFIPAIKSHIAEEVTLDRCVQRLRRRLMEESWEKHAALKEKKQGEEKMGRVPSFFSSGSVVNLSGLSTVDQPTIHGLHEYATKPHAQYSPVATVMEATDTVMSIPDIGENHGWHGMGLKGNRLSSGNLRKTISDTSGLFIEEDELPTEQAAGEQASMERKPRSSSLSLAQSVGSESSFNSNYIKTTSMANFYYRRSAKVQSNADLQKIFSDGRMAESEKAASKAAHVRRKSKSHADLDSSMFNASEGLN